jgi:threonine/homoserine/homoserine lactone efflux protein
MLNRVCKAITVFLAIAILLCALGLAAYAIFGQTKWKVLSLFSAAVLTWFGYSLYRVRVLFNPERLTFGRDLSKSIKRESEKLPPLF